MQTSHRRSGFDWVHRIVILLVLESPCITAQGVPAPQPTHSDRQAVGLMSQGLNLAAHGQLAQAEVILDQARTLAPANLEVLTALAKVKDRLGELPEAIEIFRTVTAAAPGSSEAHRNLAMALADNSDLSGALDEVSIITRCAAPFQLPHK